jgi:hypothetical protein
MAVPQGNLARQVDPIEFEQRITSFMEVMKHRINFGSGSPRVTPVDLIALDGKRYVKLATTEGGDNSPRYVAAFIDKQTGDVLKAASWKAPAKHPRGNLFSQDGGLGALSPHGHVVYLG